MRGSDAGRRGAAALACAALLALSSPSPAKNTVGWNAVAAEAAPLAENLAVGDRLASMRFLGMLAIPNTTVDGVRLSQLSDIAWDDAAGILYAVSDKGMLFHLRPVMRGDALVDVSVIRAVPLRELKTNQPLRYRRTDAEGMALARDSKGRPELLVSFERMPRVVRYRPDGYAIAEHALPPPLTDKKAYANDNRMLEALCVNARGGVLTMPERPLKKESRGFNRLYSLNGKSWRYPMNDQARVVALHCENENEVLVLETTFGVDFWRAQTRLKRVRLTESSDAVLAPRTLFTLEAGHGYQIDNFEGITRHRGNRFFLVSDDNDFFLQRTLLLYVELVED